MVRIFMDAPVGVAMPPMSTPMGRPIMSALAKLLLITPHLFCSTTLSATGASITTTGTSAMKAESTVPPAMKQSSSLAGFPPARREIHSATRSEKPVRVNAKVKQNIPKQKNTMGLAKFVRALSRGAAPDKGWIMVMSMAATARGSAPVTHTITAATMVAMAHCPWAESPSKGPRTKAMMK